MKIMHFIHGLSTGGAETLVKNYMLNFDRKNEIALLCVTHERKSPHEEEALRSGVRIIFVEDLVPSITGVVGKIRRYLAVRKVIRREKPDVLHLHLSASPMVRFARPSKRTALFYTVHSEPSALWNLAERGKRRNFEATKWLVQRYDMQMIALHEKMKKEVDKKLGIGNTLVLNNGVNTESIKRAKGRKGKLGIPEKAFVLGHVGRFSRAKNHEFLVEVFKEVKARRADTFLLMVGGGEDLHKVVEMLAEFEAGKDYLILENRDDVAEILKAMDVFVFPSLWEGLGMALIEAQVAELPCFVSDTVPAYATISNLVMRLSLDAGAEKWAESILMHKKPKKVIVNDADWDIKEITKKLERIYVKAVEEKQNGKK